MFKQLHRGIATSERHYWGPISSLSRVFNFSSILTSSSRSLMTLVVWQWPIILFKNLTVIAETNRTQRHYQYNQDWNYTNSPWRYTQIPCFASSHGLLLSFFSASKEKFEIKTCKKNLTKTQKLQKKKFNRQTESKMNQPNTAEFPTNISYRLYYI